MPLGLDRVKLGRNGLVFKGLVSGQILKEYGFCWELHHSDYSRIFSM